MDLGRAWTSASGQRGKGTIRTSVRPFIPLGPLDVPSPGRALPATASLTLTRPQFGGRNHPHFNHRTTGAWRHEQAAPGQPERQDPATGWAGGWGRWDEKERGLSVSFQLSQRLESRRSTSPQITCYRGRRRSSCPTSPLQCRPHLGTSHRATMGHPRPPYVMAPGPAF